MLDHEFRAVLTSLCRCTRFLELTSLRLAGPRDIHAALRVEDDVQ